MILFLSVVRHRGRQAQATAVAGQQTGKMLVQGTRVKMLDFYRNLGTYIVGKLFLVDANLRIFRFNFVDLH